MNEYRYMMLMRPPVPGAIPREGLVEVLDRESWRNGRHYWGEVVYSRKLTAEEVSHYELEFRKSVTINTEVGT